MNEFDKVHYQLNDMVIEIDNATADLLNRDSVFRANYEKVLRNVYEKTSPNNTHNTTELHYAELEPMMESSGPTIFEPIPNSVRSVSAEVNVWTTKKPTISDHQATLRFLQLRKTMADKFDDQKTPKNSLWQEIAKILNKEGFYVGLGLEGGEKCRKKFANLQAAYIKYKDKKHQSGQGHVNKPPYFEELEEILGLKDKVTPPIIIDSMANPEIEIQLKTPSPQPSHHIIKKRRLDGCKDTECTPTTSFTEHRKGDVDSSNKFINIKKSVRPEKNALIRELIDVTKIDIEQRKTEFNRIMSYMETTAAMRHEEMMSLLGKRKKKGKSRKSENDSDSSGN